MSGEGARDKDQAEEKRAINVFNLSDFLGQLNQPNLFSPSRKKKKKKKKKRIEKSYALAAPPPPTETDRICTALS